MEEAVVDFVRQKLEDYLTGAGKDALINEGNLLYGVNDKVDAVQRELRMITSFLQDADSRRSSQELIKKWVEDVRNVAYSIEDAVDNFQAEVDWVNYKEPGVLNFLKRIIKKPMLLPAYHTLGSDMDAVQAKIKEIADAKSNFGIVGLDGSSSTNRPHVRPLVHPDIIDEMEVVGFESDKEKIIGRLLHENTSGRSVISIVGPGGIGKTTLAKIIYNDAEVKKSFKVLIWLSVTQEYNRIDLLKKMHDKLQSANQRDHHKLTEDKLIEAIHTSMHEKKYLVVMDDVWTEYLWQQLQMAFPEAKNGSRVLITSRFFNVAPTADHKPYELSFLNEEQSVQLLLKKAIPDKDPNEPYPQDILDLAKQFAKKCGGLPLQLVVLGGLLSRKSQGYAAWYRFMQTMDWFKDGKECFDLIEASYENMPSYLKPCFMSLSVFPEDYEINAQSLVSYWCIVGFISQQGNGKMSDRAEECLEELYQRCMIQVIRKNPTTGCIEQFKVHTLLRNLAVYKAKEKSLITVYCKQEGFQEQAARHASFHFFNPKIQNNSTEKKDVLEYTGPNVRSLMFFGDILPIHSRMKLVKVLIVYRARVTFSNGRHTWLRNLIGLRHLEFRECQLENNTLPEEINCLHNLKYLDLTDTIIDLPRSILDNKALTLVVNKSEANILP